MLHGGQQISVAMFGVKSIGSVHSFSLNHVLLTHVHIKPTEKPKFKLLKLQASDITKYGTFEFITHTSS